jgi:ABC-type Fe3+/spermidine/putrescine transport system ATPase subunit
MTAALSIDGLSKRFGRTAALDQVSLEVAAGAFVAVIGGSGCGKTTLLRCIAGFAAPDAGRVRLGAHDVSALPPHRRGLGFVFQSYALFPTMDVAGNIGFALRLRGAARPAIAARVRELVALVGLDGCEERFPHELSGGQQQRVALARALAPRPPVLLLDEPLSALDAQTRVALREELRAILARERCTALYVTHDQEEALTLADHVVVMGAGRVLQQGSPRDLYRAPASPIVASFLGRGSMLAGTVVAGGLALPDGTVLPAAGDLPHGAAAIAHVRPEDVTLGAGAPAAVAQLQFAGPVLRARLALPWGGTLDAELPATAPLAERLVPGATVAWAVVAGRARIFATA